MSERFFVPYFSLFISARLIRLIGFSPQQPCSTKPLYAEQRSKIGLMFRDKLWRGCKWLVNKHCFSVGKVACRISFLLSWSCLPLLVGSVLCSSISCPITTGLSTLSSLSLLVFLLYFLSLSGTSAGCAPSISNVSERCSHGRCHPLSFWSS